MLLLTFFLLLLTSHLSAHDEVVIRRNQVGSYPWQEKVIVIEGADPKGKLQITSPSGKRLKAKSVRPAVSPLSGKTRYVVDLGQLADLGRYRVSLGGEACDVVVAEHPFREVVRAALRFFYLARSGVAIDCGGDYNRPLAHPDTAVVVHPSAASPLRPAGTVISSPLGWYDAGDYNKYVVNSAFSIGLMFAAYEQQPAYFAALRADIPESDNCTPDVLDECMFNLRWLMTMQDPSDGGVYHKLTTPRFEGFVMPEACRQQRYVVAKSVTATLDFAAVMADAARLFEHFQTDYPGFAAQVAAMAERAYRWATEHPDAFYRQERLREPVVSTGTYGDGHARDEFFWAATSLYRLTGRQAYLDDAIRYRPERYTLPTWGNVNALGMFEWLAMESAHLTSEGAEVQQTFKSSLLSYCEEAVGDVGASSFQSPYGNSARDFGWGCLAEKCCCQAFTLLLADRLMGSDRYRRFALQNADYLFGRNATGYSYVTGFGDHSPRHPHHRPSASDGIEAPWPGMLVGGPNPGQQDRFAADLTYPSSVPDESYLDHEESYASNEIAINWNASLLAFLAWLDALKVGSENSHLN